MRYTKCPAPLLTVFSVFMFVRLLTVMFVRLLTVFVNKISNVC